MIQVTAYTITAIHYVDLAEVEYRKTTRKEQFYTHIEIEKDLEIRYTIVTDMW